jgi:hypothetical protein
MRRQANDSYKCFCFGRKETSVLSFVQLTALEEIGQKIGFSTSILRTRNAHIVFVDVVFVLSEYESNLNVTKS